jgi:MFS family permease
VAQNGQAQHDEASQSEAQNGQALHERGDPNASSTLKKRYRVADPEITFMLIICLSAQIFTTILNATGSSFFPQAARDKFNLKPTVVGTINSIHPIALGASSPIVAFIRIRFGRITTVFIGLLCVTVSTMWFGTSSTLLRFLLCKVLEGFASACIRNASNALLVLTVDNLQDAVSLQTAVLAISSMISTPLGGWIFSLVGFYWTYYVCSFLSLLSL